MTAVTDRARERSRLLREQRIAANPEKLCPADHKHGAASTCYNGHGCRCEPCRVARSAIKSAEHYATVKLVGKNYKVSPLGAQRRLQALAWQGWSCEAIAQKYGTHYRQLNRVRSGGRERIFLSNHDLIAKAFTELAMLDAPGHSGRVTRAFARAQGWVSAAAWDDIDNPDEVPQGIPVSVGGRKPIDVERVEWLWAEGKSDFEIAAVMGCVPESVFRVRHRLGLETKWAA